MATVANNDVEEASPAALTSEQLSGESWQPEAEGATTSSEKDTNTCTEMQTYGSKPIAGEMAQALAEQVCWECVVMERET